MRILYNSKDLRFKSPFGTLLPGQACEINIHIPASCQTGEVRLVLRHEDGREYAAYLMERAGGEGDYEYYSVHFALPRAGLYFYYFRIITANEAFSLYREGFDQTNMEAGELWQLSCIPDTFTVPPAFRGAVMYQIFPDRFHREGQCDTAGKLTPFWLHEDVRELPCYRPNDAGEVENCDFFGGNLAGITAKLDYLRNLGVKVLYLNPIFKAWSNHRYDTADYMAIDELLGTEEDFSMLCRQAHERDIKIILDGVFSHTGSDSRYFDVHDRFGEGACHHPDSPYRSWYDFQEYPHKYTSWWGIKTLPCVNELDEGFCDYIIRNEDSVIAHWLRAGADGFRLDVADELPDAFIAMLRARIKEIKPDALLIGEVWEDASNKCSYGVRRQYFVGGELDSVMNYPFRSSIIEYVCGRDGGYGLRNTVMDIAENYPPQVLQTLMNMLSTHDTPRILSVLNPGQVPQNRDERGRYTMNEADRAVAEKRLLCAAFLQFILPGMPCIYYGDEIGSEGYEDPFCRKYFDWEKTEGNGLLDFFRELAALRNALPALQTGAVQADSDGAGRIYIERKGPKGLCRGMVNVGEPVTQEYPGEVLLARGCTREGNRICLERFGFCLVK